MNENPKLGQSSREVPSNDKGFLNPSAYEYVTSAVPMTCVDVIPADESLGSLRLGTITRATGSEAGKTALIGGRIQKDESIDQAISRHLLSTLSIVNYEFHGSNSLDRPFLIAEFKHQLSSNKVLFDPTKQSLSLVYLITIEQNNHINTANEASSFEWLDATELPDDSAFNQHIILYKARDFLQKFNHAAKHQIP